MQWIPNFSRSYGTREEYLYRFEQFARNHANLLELNNDDSNGGSARFAHNHFSDLSESEFNKMMGYRADLAKPRNKNFVDLPAANADSVNWYTDGAVTEIKNQGGCGSCWAFSAVGSIEGAHYKATNLLVSFSEQQFVDCDKHNGDMGCMGGLMD